ncbi:MAG TPA: sulfotransferase [Candidatus Polarisedimenticolaceae bacterium]|nr:sulfotransferase [Candidatus Polarisedimenticolaceae bacterium]
MTVPRLVFVAGLHRSGTTLLARCLAAHPAIAGLSGTGVPEDEGQHLQDVLPTALTLGGPGRFALRPEAHVTEDSPLVSPHARDRLLRAWGPYWDRTRPLLLEKSPPNLLRTRFLQALFPEAAFVVVVRHPVAVSLATRKWCHRPLPWLLRHWLAAHATFREDRTHLRHSMCISFERLLREPQATLAQVCAFLEVAPEADAAPVRAGANARYFARWRRALSGPLAPYARWVARRFEADVWPYGYSLQDLERVEPFA